MIVYLDNCCFNRPFDDQDQLRVRLETEAKLEIQSRILSGALDLAWSYMLDLENGANPFPERREEIAWWRGEALMDVEQTSGILQYAERLAGRGVSAKDALHVSCAVAANCDAFLTTDDQLLKKLSTVSKIRSCNPIQFVLELPS